MMFILKTIKDIICLLEIHTVKIMAVPVFHLMMLRISDKEESMEKIKLQSITIIRQYRMVVFRMYGIIRIGNKL